MNRAIRNGEALAGWQAARQELWNFVNADTIIVGHAVKNDLDVLGIIHHRIVDSAIVAKNAADGGNQWALDRLVKDFLNVPFRQNAGGIHNCLEDVMATREVSLRFEHVKEQETLQNSSHLIVPIGCVVFHS